MTARGGVVVVTGASSGIGRASALALDRAGFRVFAGVRTPDAAATGERAASSGPIPITLDVTDHGTLAGAATTVERDLERGAAAPGGAARFAGLVANAGISVNAPLEFLAPGELRRQLEVNVIGQLASVQAFLPLLRRHRGRIVLTGSVSGFLAMPLVGAYCMSKHALEAMADALRLELAPWGVRVALLEPGQVRTAIWEKGRRDAAALVGCGPPELAELYGDRIAAALRVADLAERTGTAPERVAKAVVHALTSRRPRTRYLVGGHARGQRLLAALPDRVRDAVIKRLLSG